MIILIISNLNSLQVKSNQLLIYWKIDKILKSLKKCSKYNSSRVKDISYLEIKLKILI